MFWGLSIPTFSACQKSCCCFPNFVDGRPTDSQLCCKDEGESTIVEDRVAETDDMLGLRNHQGVVGMAGDAVNPVLH